MKRFNFFKSNLSMLKRTYYALIQAITDINNDLPGIMQRLI